MPKPHAISGRARPNRLPAESPRKAAPARLSYRGNRLAQLRAFVAIARLGTLSRAAEFLSLSQPSISLQLTALEQDLGTILVERGRRRRINLTHAGQALFELARPLIADIDGLDMRFRQALSGLTGGRLTIAAGATVIQYLLSPWVAAYRQGFPDVHLELVRVGGDEGVALLRTDRADFAFASMLDVPADMDYAPLREAAPLLILPLGHPLANKDGVQLRDLSPFGLILPPQRRSTCRLVDLVFRQHGVPYTLAMEAEGWEVIKQCVAMGLGISIVSDFCVTDTDRERLVMRDLGAHFPRRSYGVITRRGKNLSAESRAFIELIGATG